MVVDKNRSQIQCYWESQSSGCTKPHCPFKHNYIKQSDDPYMPETASPGLIPIQPSKIIVNKNKLNEIVNSNNSSNRTVLSPEASLIIKAALTPKRIPIKQRLGKRKIDDDDDYKKIDDDHDDYFENSDEERLRKGAIESLDLRKRIDFKRKRYNDHVDDRYIDEIDDMDDDLEHEDILDEDLEESKVRSVIVKKVHKKEKKEKKKKKEKEKKSKRNSRENRSLGATALKEISSRKDRESSKSDQSFDKSFDHMESPDSGADSDKNGDTLAQRIAAQREKRSSAASVKSKLSKSPKKSPEKATKEISPSKKKSSKSKVRKSSVKSDSDAVQNVINEVDAILKTAGSLTNEIIDVKNEKEISDGKNDESVINELDQFINS